MLRMHVGRTGFIIVVYVFEYIIPDEIVDVRGPKMRLCSQSTGIDLISGSTLI